MATGGDANRNYEERDNNNNNNNNNNSFRASLFSPQRTDPKRPNQLKQRKSERIADVKIWRWKSHDGLSSDQRHKKETKSGHNISVSVNIFRVPCSAMSSLTILRRNAELRTGQHSRHFASAKNEPIAILKSGTKSLIYHWEKLYERSTDFVHL
jgi:hypothetical protein